MNEKTIRKAESVPGQATDAPPGSARKVRVLMERAMRREPLFHPGDNMKRILPMPTAEAAVGSDEDAFDVDLAG